MNSAHPDAVRWDYVENDAALAACCKRWQSAAALALDTEFMRVSTFYPQAALFQVSDDHTLTLVDPLGIHDWSPFVALLEDPAIVKILHSCSEDLLVFLHELGVIPAPLFDTQVAGSMLEHGLSVSYQNMVKHYLDLDIPKGETRSDWLQRPLSEQQLEYAALDVAYLHRIWEIQSEQLEKLQRTDWMREDSSRLAALYAEELSKDFSGHYLAFKSAWQLGPRQRAALQKLAEWREQRARLRDRPRNWILKDTALFAIAQSLPENRARLAALPDVGESFIRHEGEQILDLLREVKALPEAECPPALPKPFSSSQKSRLAKARTVIERKAQELSVSPEFLCRRKSLHALFLAVEERADAAALLALPPEFSGWRGAVLLEELLEALQS